MKKKILILTVLFLFTSIILGQETEKQGNKKKLIKGGRLEVKAELFKEKNIEKGMTIYGICNEDKTFSFSENDCIKSKNKLNFHGIKTGKYDIYVNISGFGVKQIKDVEIKEGELSKTEVTFNKNSKCGVEGKVIKIINDKHEWLSATVELKEEGKSPKILVGKTVVDTKGNFKIIDLKPGNYILNLDYKIKKIENGGLIVMRLSRFCKIKEDKITKEICIAKSPPPKAD